jgi:hypothetical protein
MTDGPRLETKFHHHHLLGGGFKQRIEAIHFLEPRLLWLGGGSGFVFPRGTGFVLDSVVRGRLSTNSPLCLPKGIFFLRVMAAL